VEERFFDRINIKVKGYDHPVLDSYVKFVSRAANNLDIEIHGTAALPTRVKKFTVLKSPHIYKKHRVQFETRTHARLLQIRRITGTTADIFLEYIQRNLPEGVSMSLYQEAFEALPNLLMEPPSKDESKKVKKSK
jgi:small subunit ribosomal protein S10